MRTYRPVLRSLGPTDLEAIVLIHRAAFAESILTKLGEEAVCRYYSSLMTGPHEMYSIGAVCDGQLAGYLFGGVALDAITGFLRSNRGLLARCLARRPWLAADAVFRKRIGFALTSIIHRPRYAAAAAPDVAGCKRPFEIISVAVGPRAQGGGIGTCLMREAEAIARRNAFRVMTLMVQVGNLHAIRFYESLGWQKLLRAGIWRGNMEFWLVER